MLRNRRVSIFQLLITLILLYTIMPIVSRMISTYLTTYFYMLVVLFVEFSIIFASRFQSFNKYVGGILLPFILYNAMTYFVRTDSIVLWGYKVLLALLPIVLGFYITEYKQSQVKYYSRVICLALVVTMITTSIGLTIFPNASRILATIASSQDTAATTYNWYNIGGYDFIYSLVLLYPILIMAYKQKKINTLAAVCGTIMIFTTVLLSEYATALLLLLLSTVLFFVKRDLTKRDTLLLLFVGILALIFFQDSVSQLLSYIGNLTGSETISTRFSALAGGQSALEASDDNRIELYRLSLNTFLRHPLLGTFLSGGGGLGGHSFILDFLGQYGAIGVALLYCMYRKLYYYFVAPFKAQPGYGFVLWTFLQAILLSTINTGMWLNVLALMMPILVTWIYRNTSSEA